MNTDERHGTSFQAGLTDATSSPMKRYREMVVGDVGLAAFLRYELTTCLFGGARGAFGFWARKSFFRKLFMRTGRGLILGRDITLRHPARISIGDNVAIDDGCQLDGRGHGEGPSLSIGSRTIVSRNCVLSSKDGVLAIGESCNFGAECLVYASHGKVVIESSVLFAARCYIGGGRYHHDKLDVPIMDQGQYFRGDTVIEKNSWFGAGAIVLDGVRVGHDSIVGAGAVVTSDLPPYSIAVGVPAKVVRLRTDSPAKS